MDPMFGWAIILALSTITNRIISVERLNGTKAPIAIAIHDS